MSYINNCLIRYKCSKSNTYECSVCKHFNPVEDNFIKEDYFEYEEYEEETDKVEV